MIIDDNILNRWKKILMIIDAYVLIDELYMKDEYDDNWCLCSYVLIDEV